MTGVDSSYEFVTMSETSTANDPAQAASWDLTSQISPHLDLHMMFPLLEYVDSLITAGLVPYTHGDVAASRLALLRPTHMVDYAMDIYRELHGADAEIPKEMETQKEEVFKNLESLRDGCVKFDELCRDEAEKVSQHGSDWMMKEDDEHIYFSARVTASCCGRTLSQCNST
jgi:translation initiation factor 3 subunit E